MSLETVTICDGLVYGEIIFNGQKFKMEGDVASKEALGDIGEHLEMRELEMNKNIDFNDSLKDLAIEVLLVTDESMSIFYEVSL